MTTASKLRPFCPAVLLAFVAAFPPSLPAQETARTAELQSLVERAARHLQLRKESHRGNEATYRASRDLLRQTLAAWNESARTDQDADAMQQWLEGVVRSSMLGSRGDLPTPPEFQPAPVAEVVTAEPVTAEPVAAEPSSPIAYDPAPSEPLTTEPPTFAPDPIEAEPATPQQVTRRRNPPQRMPQPEPQPKPAPPADAWAAHPAAGQLDWSDPFADDGARLARQDPAGSSKRFKPVSRSQSVKIDLLELSSRVAGYNSRLRDLEGLLVGARELSAFRLAALMRDLDELNDQRGFLQLYLAGLSPDEAEVGPQLQSANTLQRLIGRAIDRRGDQLANLNGDRAEAESAILAALSRKLGQFDLE